MKNIILWFQEMNGIRARNLIYGGTFMWLTWSIFCHYVPVCAWMTEDLLHKTTIGYLALVIGDHMGQAYNLEKLERMLDKNKV